MKRNRIYVFLLSLIIFVSCFVLLTACGDSDDDKSQLQQLSAPIVTLQEDIASWEINAKATRFEISVNGNLSYVENSVISKKLVDGQTLKVRAIGDGVKYLDSVWSNAVTYTAPAVVEKFTVIWKNGDATLETDIDIEKGTVPVYDGDTPTKEKDVQYTYAFTGWSPEISAVTNDVTYYAQFSSTLNKYTVVWKNGNNVLETDTEIEYGTTPEYDGQEPSKTSTAQYSYTFDGWSPSVDTVTGDVIYSAKFKETINRYTITFYNEIGTTVLGTVTVNYGENAEYSKSAPVKNATESHTYIFDKWVTTQGGNLTDDLSNVISDRSVYASFKEFTRAVSVFVVSNNTDYGTVTVSTLSNIPYGSSITVNGNTVTINGQTVTAQANTKTAQYTYSFDNWTTDATVGSDTIITANFVREINKYTVTWKNGEDILEIDENVSYGATPVYNGSTPTKSNDNENIYTFSGWSPATSMVVGDIIYEAQFSSKANNHIVIFYDEDGTTELGRAVVVHGETATYPNALPTKEPTVQYSYIFDKWVTEIGGSIEAILTNITDDTSIYAKYAQSVREYVVTFCDYDGTVLVQNNVAYGASAIVSVEPEREGYRFDGWDKTFDNITSDITLTAKYVKQYTVEFVDYDNSIIDIQLIDNNGDAVAPESPERNNYRFIGWNTSFGNIASDLIVRAEYVRQYKVTFVCYDGVVFDEQIVDENGSATSPETVPTLEGYDFNGWDKEYTNITSDVTITATYKIKKYTVKFIMPDGTEINEQTVEHGFSAVAPKHDEVYFDGQAAKGFTRWNTEFSTVTDNLIVTAVYESSFATPLIIFRNSSLNKIGLYIYCDDSVILNAIEFSLSYKADIGNVSIDKVSFVKASPLWIEDSNGNNNNQYVINNNENTFTFAWSDADGVSFNYSSQLLSFDFITDANDAKISFEMESSAIISGSDGENLEKVTPLIIYK